MVEILQINQTLQEFGLTQKEAQVYLLLLSHSLTAAEITRKTDIHRMSIYDILERLQEKGLISYVIQGKRKIYESTDPRKLLKNIDEKRQKINNILPSLIERKNLLEEQQEATIFKDKKGIKNLLEEITKSKTTVLLFASGWGFKQNFPDYYLVWCERFKINHVKIKSLLSSKFKNDPSASGPIDHRYLPSEFQFPSTTCVWEDKVLIMMWSDIPIAFLIRSKHVSESYKNFFELLWKQAKP